MSILAESIAKARGNEICTTLSLRGYEPLWFKTEADGFGLVVCFQILPAWRKALVLDANDDPNTAEAALNLWKRHLLDELNDGVPRQIVQDAIARYGEVAVRAALTPTTVH